MDGIRAKRASPIAQSRCELKPVPSTSQWTAVGSFRMEPCGAVRVIAPGVRIPAPIVMSPESAESETLPPVAEVTTRSALRRRPEAEAPPAIDDEGRPRLFLVT